VAPPPPPVPDVVELEVEVELEIVDAPPAPPGALVVAEPPAPAGDESLEEEQPTRSASAASGAMERSIAAIGPHRGDSVRLAMRFRVGRRGRRAEAIAIARRPRRLCTKPHSRPMVRWRPSTGAREERA
jgi:hypothetical protein